MATAASSWPPPPSSPLWTVTLACRENPTFDPSPSEDAERSRRAEGEDRDGEAQQAHSKRHSCIQYCSNHVQAQRPPPRPGQRGPAPGAVPKRSPGFHFPALRSGSGTHPASPWPLSLLRTRLQAPFPLCTLSPHAVASSPRHPASVPCRAHRCPGQSLLSLRPAVPHVASL